MDYLGIVKERVALKEGVALLERYLKKLYLEGKGVPGKSLAVFLHIPVPVAAAIKKEFIGVGLVKQDSGVCLTAEGKTYVEDRLGFRGLDTGLYRALMESYEKREGLVQELCGRYGEIFADRPQADVTVDQAKATVETAFRRAMLCLEQECLINRRILCVGDDDFISVAIGLLLKRLYIDDNSNASEICAFDVDGRIVAYIHELAQRFGLPVKAVRLDFRDPLPITYANYFDTFFTDPPYTPDGAKLFLSRGIGALKKERGNKVFFSFGNKAPDETLELQRTIIEHGLSILSVLKGFNKYEGASLLGGSGQMLILETSDSLKSEVPVDEAFRGQLYTAQLRNNTTAYVCKACGKSYTVGKGQEIATVEQLKESGCPVCKGKVFVQQRKERPDYGQSSERILGRHILADFFACDKREIEDVDRVQAYMHEAAKCANATIVTEQFHHFSPWGVSGAIIIQESHLTIHTWPEYGYAAVDIFTCGNSLDLWKALFYLRDKLQCRKMEHNEIARGRMKLKEIVCAQSTQMGAKHE